AVQQALQRGFGHRRPSETTADRPRDAGHLLERGRLHHPLLHPVHRCPFTKTEWRRPVQTGATQQLRIQVVLVRVMAITAPGAVAARAASCGAGVDRWSLSPPRPPASGLVDRGDGY